MTFYTSNEGMYNRDDGREYTHGVYNDDDFGFEEDPRIFNTRGIKGNDSLEKIVQDGLGEREPFEGRLIQKQSNISFRTLNGDTRKVYDCFKNDAIVDLIKTQFPEFQNQDFYIMFAGSANITDEDYDTEFVQSKEKLGLFPNEISSRILEGKIDLTKPENMFILVYTSSETNVEKTVQKEFVFNESDFHKLSA